MSDRRRIERRLHQVIALRDRATTEGEREAADRARVRLLARLGGLPRPAAGERTVVGGMGPLPDSHPGVDLPDEAELRALLIAWARGEVDRRDLGRWAAWYVDKLVLPELPLGDPAALRVEIILQLSSHRRCPIRPTDAPEILAFLDLEPEEGLRSWLEWLGSLDWKGQRGRTGTEG